MRKKEFSKLKMFFVLLVLFLFLLLSSSLLADSITTSEDRKDVAVTVYNQNIALVKEVRVFEIDQGVSELRFMDVAAMINPKTTYLKSLSQPNLLAIFEQNYEYDLISPDKLMEKYVGKEVELIEQNEQFLEKKTKALLLSMNQGPVYKIGDKISIGHSGRVILPKLPENLVSRPTLVWLLNNQGKEKHDVEVSYLTGGLNWLCDYVASVNEEDTAMGLTGWVTLENRSGATYENALLKLVAGEIHLAPDKKERIWSRAYEADIAEAPQFAEEEFFEYHLYTLDRRTSLKDRQTKQMSLFSVSEVPVKKKLLIVGNRYYYRSRAGTISQNQKVDTFLEFKNSQKHNLGMPLPKGTVRVYKKDKSGALQFIGEDKIDHTPKDEMLQLKIGTAFDVVSDRIQTDFKKIKIGRYNYESAYEIKIRNHKDTAIEIIVREPIPGEWVILESSHSYEKIDAHTIEYQVSIPPNNDISISYRVRVGW